MTAAAEVATAAAAAVAAAAATTAKKTAAVVSWRIWAVKGMMVVVMKIGEIDFLLKW